MLAVLLARVQQNDFARRCWFYDIEYGFLCRQKVSLSLNIVVIRCGYLTPGRHDGHSILKGCGIAPLLLNRESRAIRFFCAVFLYFL
ncbi:hypothetical protein KCP70_18820 [Salmonella enterica subsp. enterica]|nr:hypothetical protein KCP70_18820 [Salmonella enterica subsp. enterica]